MSLFDSPFNPNGERLPEAFDGCTCDCHRMPGVCHVIACCGVGGRFRLFSTDTPPAEDQTSEPSTQVEGLAMEQSTKYTVRGGKIVNRATGEAIPDDEAVLIIRAKDPHAVSVAAYYLAINSHPGHVSSMSKLLQQFIDYQQSGKCKQQPDA